MPVRLEPEQRTRAVAVIELPRRDQNLAVRLQRQRIPCTAAALVGALEADGPRFEGGVQRSVRLQSDDRRHLRQVPAVEIPADDDFPIGLKQHSGPLPWPDMYRPRSRVEAQIDCTGRGGKSRDCSKKRQQRGQRERKTVDLLFRRHTLGLRDS